jgi:hypothetical protein
MAATTRRVLIELVQRQLSGGMISQDSDLSTGLINQYINSAVGYAAKAQYKEEIQLNGIENIADAFYSEFTGITITKDAVSGQYRATLPQQPVGIGVGWDISDFMLIAGSGAKIFASPISPREVHFLYELGTGCDEVYFWVNGLIASLHACSDITKYKANVRMISSQSSDLDAPMNIPDAYLPLIIEYIDKTLGFQMNMPIDSSEDGKPTPQIR